MKFKRAKRVGKAAVCCAMAACMCVAFVPAQAFAAGSARYVKSVHMAYGKNGAQKLEDAGYTVVEDEDGNAADLNADTGKSYCYMGYETTTDPDEAITDIAVMDMKGGYSISDYKEILSGKKDNVKVSVQNLWPAIVAFRANKANKVKGIDGVVALMNKYTEDDSKLGMGDFLLDEEKCTQDTLTDVFLQGNSQCVLALEYLLSQGVASDWTSKFTTEYINAIYPNSFEPTAQLLLDQFDSLYKNFKTYEKSELKITSDTEDVEEAGDDEAADVTKYGSAYEAFKRVAYGDGTLLDLVKKGIKNLESTDLYPIAAALSEAQVDLLSAVGFDTLVIDSITFNTKASETALESASEAVDETLDSQNVENISFYDGVNRTLFNGNVALTNDAIRENASSGDTSMFFNNSTSRILYVVAGVCALSAIICFVKLYNSGLHGYAQSLWADLKLLKGMSGKAADMASYAQNASTKFYGGAVAIGILALAACVMAGIAIGKDLWNYYHPDYYDIPDMIVDEVDYTDEDGDPASYYVDYSVVRLLDGTTAGDTNTKEGQQWNCIYTTKDHKAGDPVTVDDLYVQYNDNDVPNDLCAVHMFGNSNDAAFNLNSHTYGSCDGIYMIFGRDDGAFVTGSTFGGGYLFLAAGIGLIVGVAGTLGVSAALRRRKRASAAA